MDYFQRGLLSVFVVGMLCVCSIGCVPACKKTGCYTIKSLKSQNAFQQHF